MESSIDHYGLSSAQFNATVQHGGNICGTESARSDEGGRYPISLLGVYLKRSEK